MKKGFAVLLCVLFIFTFANCGGGSSIDGTIWEGVIMGDYMSITFIGDYCFFNDGYGVYNEPFTYDKGSGTIGGIHYGFPYTINGNTLTAVIDGFSIPLIKDTKTKAAPSAIRGIWTGQNDWVFAFVNDKVYLIDNDKDEDFGIFTFDRNSGSFISDRYNYNIDFTVSGRTLNATVSSIYFSGNLTFNKQ